MTWGSTTDRYDLNSTTTSIGVTILGLAVKDGLVATSDGALQRRGPLQYRRRVRG